MGSTEKLCLRWNDFESNVSSAFAELRDDADFFDVTLAAEDNKQVQAHKVILAACSNFFRQVLKANPHDRPLLYLKGVRHSELVSVINFMYHGEVSVAQDHLTAFLAVAEDLSVKGLTTEVQNKASAISSKHKSDRPGPKSSKHTKEPPSKRQRTEEESSICIKDEPSIVGVSLEEGLEEKQGEDEDYDDGGGVDEEAFETYEGYEEGEQDYEDVGMAAAGTSADTGGNKG